MHEDYVTTSPPTYEPILCVDIPAELPGSRSAEVIQRGPWAACFCLMRTVCRTAMLLADRLSHLISEYASPSHRK